MNYKGKPGTEMEHFTNNHVYALNFTGFAETTKQKQCTT